VLSLSAHVISVAEHKQLSGKSEHSSDVSDVSRTFFEGSRLQNSFSPDSKAILTGPGHVSTDENSGFMQGLLVTTNDHEVKITRATISGAGTSALQVKRNQDQLQLLSLPSSLDTKNTSISVKFSTESAGSLKILLNRQPCEGYSLSEGREAQFATIVEKEVSSIVQVSDRIRPEGSDRTVDEPPAKRIKMASESS
jgi:hypothetical protein